MHLQSWTRLAAALTAVIALVGCGGDEPSREDVETLKVMLTSSATVQRAMEPLYLCLPENIRCYTSAGPNVVRTTRQERERFEGALAETDNSCLKEAGELYSDSLAGYAAAGRAATNAKPAVVDAELSRTTDLEIALNEKFSSCGFSEGRTAELTSAVRRVQIQLLKDSEALIECKTRPCIMAASRRLEKSSDRGINLLAELQSGVKESCMRDGFRTFEQSLRAAKGMAVALQRERYTVAEREGIRSDRLRSRAQEQMAACLSTITE